MFQIFKNPQYDFIGRSRLLLGLSCLLVAASIVVVLVKGIDFGIEFTGGTELQVKYSGTPDIAGIRAALERVGLPGQVTTIGEPHENEISIRLAQSAATAEAKDPTGLVMRTLRAGAERAGQLDLNVADDSTIRVALSEMPGIAPEQAKEIAEAIAAKRKAVAIFGSVDDLRDVPGITAEVLGHLAGRAYVGPLALRSQSFIGPAVGAELLHKAELAIVMSLLSMLVYIWIRFQIQWGVAAVLALVHDTVVALGLFALFDKEMSLSVVAAFLTLIGYSVNDTVVVFDRVRENLRNRTTTSFEATINASINQTLGRTIITSGLTWISVLALFLFGGAALNAFSFVLTVGIVVGTYSSISIATPVLILWSRFLGKEIATPPQATPVRRTRKVETPSS